MSMTLLWALICLIIFVVVLAHPKLPNWMTFICMAPVVLLAKVMEAKDIYAVLNNSSLHLMVIICMFSGMIAATGLDIIIGDFVDRVTSSQTGKKKEMMIFAIVYIVSGLISTVLQNSYVAMAFLPVLKSIARKNRISLSKLVLFVIFSTTLGGAITLIGTPTNVYANTALEEAGLQLFGMLDFAWVGIPIFIVGGLYMIIMNRWCASYDDFGEAVVEKTLTAEQKKKQMVVGIAFLVFVIALVLKSLKVISIDPNFIGYAMIAIAILTTIVSPKEAMSSLDAQMILFCAGINLMIAVMNQSGLGQVFGDMIIKVIGESRNLYLITAVLCIGASIATSFMNNMACAGMLAPVGISIANALGANPQAIVLAIAIGAGCSYLTPIASGTNQTMLIFTKLKFQDFAKFGWPLLIISWILCIAILPQAYVIYTSFKNTQGKIFVDGYSLQSYQTAIGKLGRSIQNTIIIPLLALVVIVLLAVLIAYLVVRRRNALTNVVDILSMIPYIVPGTVLGIALLIGFNKPPLLISGTMLIMVVALIIRRLPYTIRSSVAILQQIPMSIEEAAISLGASKMKAFFRITVPMMASGIISGAILSWVTMISELSTAIILYTGKTKTLTVAIYTEVIRGNYGTAAALSTIMTILTVISLLAFSKLNGGKDISL